MLILTRKLKETVVIEDRIRVTILDVRGTNVRLGIDAPKTVSVDREEIYETKRRAGKKES